MKRLLIITLCLCMLSTALPATFVSYTDEDADTDITYDNGTWDDPDEVEIPYLNGSIIYNLEDELDVLPITDETAIDSLGSINIDAQSIIKLDASMKKDEIDSLLNIEDEDALEIFDNISYDAENQVQLNNMDYVNNEIVIKFKEPWQVPGKEKQLRYEIEKIKKLAL